MSEHVHILIVEDSKTQASEIKYFLVKSGYDVSVCHDGEEAWTFMQKQEVPPSLVISDIIMPKMDGYELCEKIRQHEKFSDVMVMLLTALTEPTDIIKGLKSLADSFFIKPYNKNFLLEHIGQLLEYRNFIKEMPTDMGLAIDFFGQRQFITSNRVQIINNLLSAHDTVETQSKELKRALEAEKKLKESEEKYRSFVQNFQGIAYRADLTTWTPIFFHGAVKEITGYSEDEFINGSPRWDQVIHPEDIDNLTGKEAFQCVPHYSIVRDYRIIRKDGNVRWVHELSRNICNESGKPVEIEGTIVDITIRRQEEDEKERLAVKYRQAQKMESLGLLAGGVAHDLNNVLSGTVSYPELLLTKLPEDSNLRKPLETIMKSGLRAVAIVQEMLTIARGVATTKEPLNLNDQVVDYLNSPEFKRLKQFNPAVMLKTNLDTGLLNIGGSIVHIRKVVMNLVSNASEAIKGRGNVTISTVNRYVDIPLKSYDDISIGEYAILSVSDDGSGISPDDLERIFEPFYTKKVMGKSGTGLGLSVVWNVMQDHKGYIDVTTDENGTTFELYFPVTRDEIWEKDIPLPINDYKGNEETILVVDDEESQREISCKMLDTLGYKSKAVSSGEEAVEYIKKHTVDLLLLDMIMAPGISGRETYERIIKIHPNQKAIMVSGFSETDDVKKAQKLGAGRYVKKPFILEKIGIAVKEELVK